MNQLPALRAAPQVRPWKKGDVLVLFGELFSRGYANGLVEEAERCGLTVVRATVGRRDKDGTLRALNAEEVASIPQPFINVPLEAGFDLEPSAGGKTPIDFIKDVKLSEWENATLDGASLEDSRTRSVARFRKNTTEFLKLLEPQLPAGANVIFAHLMAGGVPRTKIVMPLLNRVVKGTGERALASEKMWTSPIGQFCAANFREVTAETYRHLIELSAPLREKIKTQGGRVSYLAYGYHGTEIRIGEEWRWQTYTPYLQGWAKLALEEISTKAKAQGISSCVYNCPEILTNSSSIFQGVEVSLYPLLESFRVMAPKSAHTERILKTAAELLTNGDSVFATIKTITDAYFSNPLIQEHCQLSKWPQHSNPQQLEIMLKASDDLIALHKDPKKLLTAELSEVVFAACGQHMLHDAWEARQPVAWLSHDAVVNATCARP